MANEPAPARHDTGEAEAEAVTLQLRESVGEPTSRPLTGAAPGSEGGPPLLGEIARGGMGAVHWGRDSVLGRDIAIKVMLEPDGADLQLRRRFTEEAQITGRLQHPGVVPVYEFGQYADGRPYFTMKLVHGKTLADLLAARPCPADDRPRLLNVFVQVCQTVAFAHSRGVIHRDLKPSNVMVGAFGEVQVMDWGLAKALDPGGIPADAARTAAHPPEPSGTRTQAGSVMGTPAYMPREQALGEVDRLDERADVFGLGAILCEILTGRPPYTGTNAQVWHRARRADLTEAIAQLQACDAEAELTRLAQHCLGAEPEERPRDAAAVAAALTAYLDSVAGRLRQAELAQAAEEARRVEAQATAEQERRARRLLVSLACTVALAAALGLGALSWMRAQEARRQAMEAQRMALADLSLDESRAAQALLLLLHQSDGNREARHMVTKIQLVQMLGRAAFGDSPEARAAAAENFKVLYGTFERRGWFSRFTDWYALVVEVILDDHEPVANRREALLTITHALQEAIFENKEREFLDPLKPIIPQWRAQLLKAAEKVAAAADAGRPLDEVSLYAGQFWRLSCGELVLVERPEAEKPREGFSEQLAIWEESPGRPASTEVREAMRAALARLREAYATP